jgi:hypothetical protein
VTCRWFAVAALTLATAPPCAAQEGLLRGYVLDVAGVSGSSVLGPGGASDFLRLRFMATPAAGPLRFEAAYEQLLLYQEHPEAAFGALTPGTAPAPSQWLDLDWTLERRGRVLWRHRFDRLDVALPVGRVEARVGRQAISWATTLLLTPADPFAPFDPSDPFREYRGGVDAVRLQYFPSAFGQLDLVVRPERTAGGRTVTAALRGRMTAAGWDLSSWAGVVHGTAAGAVGVTRSAAGAALRAEAEVRRDTAGAAVLRAVAGADRRWSVLGRDLYVVLEYQHDGLGAARPEALLPVVLSAPYQRGDMQVLGRDVAAGQLTYQLHPLLAGELLALWDLRDGSLLVAPAASYSASDDVAMRAGLFLPAGRRGSALAPGSEFGVVPRFGYVSVSLFF